MKNVMVDLETLGLKSTAVVVSIGAVKFDETGIGTKIDLHVNFQDQIDLGRTVDADAVQWWMNQSDAARKSTFNGSRLTTYKALAHFSKFFEGSEFLWGNGASFDNAILESLYGTYNMKTPWRFTRNRCYRTLAALIPDIRRPPTTGFVEHNALDDAIMQAQHAVELLEALNDCG